MYVTENLVEQIKDNTSTEFAQGRFSRDTVINLCNQETIKRIRPIVSDLQAEFFVVNKSVALAQGDQKIRLPKRAAARGLRDLYLLVGTDRYPLDQMTRESSILTETTGQGIPMGFYFDADAITLDCPVSQACTLVLLLEVSPGSLVLSSAVTTVTSVDFTSGVVTVAGTPSGYGGTVEYDFVQQLGFGNAALAVGVTPLTVVGTTYTFTASELPTTLRVGDYLTLAGQTPVPNMPDEAVVTLIHAVSCRIFKMRGDTTMLGAEQAELTNSIIYLERALSDRAEGARTTLVPSSSLLRSSRFRRLGYV
jgi:hypothetical protein